MSSFDNGIVRGKPKLPNGKYRDNFDKIFGNKDKKTEKKKEKKEKKK